MLNKKYQTLLPYFCIIIFLIVLEFYNYLKNPTPFIRPDSNSYIEMAKQPIINMKWFVGNRSPTMPFIIKLLQYNLALVIGFQRILSVFSWCWLGFCLSYFFSNKMKFIVFLVTSFFGQIAYIEQWDHFVLSESLSFSMTALFLSAILLFACYLINYHRFSKIKILVLSNLFISTLLFIFCRDANFSLCIIALFIIIVYLLYLIFKKNNKADILYVLCASILLLFCIIFFLITFNKSDRWKSPLVNVIFQRVLTNNEKLSIFRNKHKIPVDDELMKFAGEWAYNENYKEGRKNSLPNFQNWINSCGRKEYEIFLITNLIPSLSESWDSFKIYKNSFVYYNGRNNWNIITRITTKILFPHMANNKQLWIFLIILLLIVFINFLINKNPNLHVINIFVVVILLYAFSHMFVGFHGDAMNVDRHTAEVPIILRLSFWISLLCFSRNWTNPHWELDSQEQTRTTRVNPLD